MLHSSSCVASKRIPDSQAGTLSSVWPALDPHVLPGAQHQHPPPLPGCFLGVVPPNSRPTGSASVLPLLPVVGSEVGCQEHGGFFPLHARGWLKATGGGGAREHSRLIILPWSQWV